MAFRIGIFLIIANRYWEFKVAILVIGKIQENEIVYKKIVVIELSWGKSKAPLDSSF